MPTPESRLKTTNTTCRDVSKPTDSDWITSGKLGTRDAVLVFRTNRLYPVKRALPIISSSLSLVHSKSELAVNCQNKDGTRSLFEGDSLPSTSRSVSNLATSATTENRDKSKTNSTALPPITSAEQSLTAMSKSFGYNNLLIDRKTSSLDLQKHMPHSLSSSDNSMSSECDENPDADDEKKKTALDDQRKGDFVANIDVVPVDYALNSSSEGESELVVSNEEYNDEQDYSQMKEMPAVELKITYKFVQTETKLLRKIFMRHGLTEVEGDENYNILWTGIQMKADILRNLAPYQRVNHFPRSYELTRKDRLYKNIERMQHLRGMKHFDIIPQSFILPLEYRDLISAHNKCRGPWIVKPAASSRGRGIFIVNTPDQIPQDEQGLVSKYIAEPLCIDGHKCDLRVYVLVTSFDPLIIYIYEEGLVRLATVKYDRKADNLWNPCMHLCNYSINKYHSDYIKSNDAQDEDVGHKWTLSALLRHLKSQGCNTLQLMTNIEDLVIKSIFCCAQSVISACRMFVPSGNNCFELYGFDILIDNTLKPWLLEVNLSPSMGVDTPLDTKVKSSLITDLLTCIGIPAYTPAMRSYYDSKWTRFRNISVPRPRRANSADRVSRSTSGGQGARRSGGHSSMPLSPPLTLEEQRIVRNTRLQNIRRGGFVRIFPTEDTMQRYGSYLDTLTGIPMSTPVGVGQLCYTMASPHNYNQMLFSNLYGKDAPDQGRMEENSQEERMVQYERVLEMIAAILFAKKPTHQKCDEERKHLRKHVLKQLNKGLELSRAQCRQAFGMYLEAILRRITQEPKETHEKLILKFLSRVGSTIKAPAIFRSPQNAQNICKTRSAMVAKFLCDYLMEYNRETDTYVESCDHFGMLPRALFNEFLSVAQESDLEAVLVLNTNLTGTMPYLFNRCAITAPTAPPIPTGTHGFLRALPVMASGLGTKDFFRSDGYLKGNELKPSKSDIIHKRGGPYTRR